jgi:hypothetical protein
MFRIVAACLAAVVVCSGCLLTKEDLDCWYDDMCMAASGAKPAPTQEMQPALTGR